MGEYYQQPRVSSGACIAGSPDTAQRRNSMAGKLKGQAPASTVLNCLLQETAHICPMQCPKGLRNGPCGSGAADGCCVDPSRPCVWHLIYERAEAQGTLNKLMEHSPEPEETGLEIAPGLIEEIKQLPGVSGIHLMSVGWEAILPRLLCEAGMFSPSVSANRNQPWPE